MAGTAVAAVLIAGCGGSSSHSYLRTKTVTCLKMKPVQLGGPLDFVASTAIGGAVKVHTEGNFVTVVFGKTVAAGGNIADAYRRFAAKNVGVNDVLIQDQNAVLLWHLHPSQSDLSLVTGCLK